MSNEDTAHTAVLLQYFPQQKNVSTLRPALTGCDFKAGDTGGVYINLPLNIESPSERQSRSTKAVGCKQQITYLVERMVRRKKFAKGFLRRDGSCGNGGASQYRGS